MIKNDYAYKSKEFRCRKIQIHILKHFKNFIEKLKKVDRNFEAI